MAITSGKIKYGFTLIEMMVAMAIVGLLMFAVGTVLADSQTSWNIMYNRANSGPVVDGLVAVREFNRTIRKSTKTQCDTDGSTYLQVYYYKNPSDTTVTSCDGYSKFYYVANQKTLKVDDGDLTPGTWTPAGITATRTIAQNVQSCAFTVNGDAVAMVLRLDASQNTNVKDGNVQMTVTYSAVRHNQ
jgi:prepilin-type N-terminal cleavage/methylation domain-containing protein